jgi:MFS family permease
VPPGWIFVSYAAYGFFFIANYPMVEAALLESVPSAVRGRIFGIFITIGGCVSNLSHWLVGFWVKHLGDDAHTPSGYFATYSGLAGMMLVSLLALPCLHFLRKLEMNPARRSGLGAVAPHADSAAQSFPR